jgi:hypothetical protein
MPHEASEARNVGVVRANDKHTIGVGQLLLEAPTGPSHHMARMVAT